MSKTGHKYSRDTVADSGKMFDFMFIIKAVAIAYAVSVVLLLLTALIATFQSMSDKGISIMVNTVTALGTVMCGFLNGRRSPRGGMICGAVSGVTYTLFLCLAGNLASQSFSFGINSITAQIIGIVCGAVGGIIGINTVKKRRR